MCVIIYVPANATIDKSEVLDAWRTNPDGAGFAFRGDGRHLNGCSREDGMLSRCIFGGCF